MPSPRSEAGPAGLPPTLRERLTLAVAALERAGLPDARPSAERLLLHVIGQSRAFLYAHPEQRLTPAQQSQFDLLLEERARGVPVQYLTGSQEFFGREFQVTRDVLIPRPETELAVETVLDLVSVTAAARLADVGTGSGCIAVSVALERPLAQMVATDLSATALAVARSNARRLGAGRVQFLRGDLLQPLRSGSLDVVVSNPPYIAAAEMAGLQREVREHEPALALTPGSSGLEIYQRLVPQALDRLRPGGWLVMELGSESAAGVRPLFGPQWEKLELLPDLQGWQRVIRARKTAAADAPGGFHER